MKAGIALPEVGSESLSLPHLGPDITVLVASAHVEGSTEFVNLLADNLPPEAHTIFFLWRKALFSKYDVFHVHWPEHLVKIRPLYRRLLIPFMTHLLLLRLRLTRTPIVRTVHNLVPHSNPTPTQTTLMAQIDNATTLFIHLNASQPPGARIPTVAIPHGHYKGQAASIEPSNYLASRVLFMGRIEPYKGLEELLAVFHELPADWCSLRIVGLPTVALRDLIAAAEARNRAITSSLTYVKDHELAAEMGASTLVVLPYREIYNSGVALRALSARRPILVPNTPATSELAAEMGDDWVIRYDGALTVEALQNAVTAAKTLLPRMTEPEMHGRDWPAIGAMHYAAYQTAIALARHKPRRPNSK